MIKEKKKKTKYNFKKSTKQIVFEYLRTVFFSCIFALIITTSLTLHARNEMIQNIYAENGNRQKLEREQALELITQSDLLTGLSAKTYSMCMHIGDLYEAAGDYKDAQIAYEYAIQKAKPGAYKAYYKLIYVLLEQEKFSAVEDILANIKDKTDKSLVKFKTRAYIVKGDKYYSIGKFLSAAKAYEQANFYYNKFEKKDHVVEESIQNRIVNSYIQVADIMVKSGYNSDAVRFLQKAEKYSPKDFQVRYKLAIVLSDSAPEKSVEYLDKLLEEKPQEIDYSIYGRALMKAANIADLDDRPTQAKYYRYKIHSIDLFVNRKVVYKNDIEVNLKSFSAKKVLFTYPLKATYEFTNVSNVDIIKLYADFELLLNGKVQEAITKEISNKKKPLYASNIEPNAVNVAFNKKIFTRKELENYTIRILLYKDPKYKTLVSEITIPRKSF